MKNLGILIPRVLFGAPLVFFGLIGLFKIRPDPHAFMENAEGFNPVASSLLLEMWDSGFMMMGIVLVHLLVGLLVLSNRFVPLILIIHLPVSIGMILFHLTLDVGTGGIAYLIFGLHVYLLYTYRTSYAELLKAKTEVS